jgi:predicted dehydrogenase
MRVISAAKPLRIGLLGASRIAPGAVITPAAARDDVVITAVAARDPDRAAAYAREHRIAAVAANYEALIAREDVDLVYNGLPIAAHAEWTLRALAAGKAVLCEKAFAMNRDEARRMVDAAERAGLPLLEAFHYRFHAVIRRAVEVVRSGELGELVDAEAHFNVPIAHDPNEIRWRADQGGGALGDLGAYPAHALRTLIGEEPRVVSASAEMRDSVDASTRAELRFGGVPARLACSMIEDRPGATLTLRGQRGALTIVNFIAPQIGCRFTVTIDGVEREEPTDGPSTYAAQLEHVVQVVAGRITPLTGGQDAVANMILLDSIRAAARS